MHRTGSTTELDWEGAKKKKRKKNAIELRSNLVDFSRFCLFGQFSSRKVALKVCLKRVTEVYNRLYDHKSRNLLW